MYAIIKDSKFIGFCDYKPSKENFSFDEYIEGDFNVLANYTFQDGKLVIVQEDVIQTTFEEEFDSIKKRFQNEIFGKYSQTDQLNMNARITEINTSCLLANRVPTDAELWIIGEGQQMINWIKEKRLECSQLIDSLKKEYGRE